MVFTVSFPGNLDKGGQVATFDVYVSLVKRSCTHKQQETPTECYVLKENGKIHFIKK